MPLNGKGHSSIQLELKTHNKGEKGKKDFLWRIVYIFAGDFSGEEDLKMIIFHGMESMFPEILFHNHLRR